MRMVKIYRSLAIVFVLAVQSLAAKEVRDESSELFEGKKVLRLKIEVAPADVEKIGAENRPYVRATVIEDDKVTYAGVGIKLKGSQGSFRAFNDKPALTLKVNKFKKKQSFHGLRKFHLNNSVQDETYLHELLSSEIFRAAGYPATRVTHARVWLNGRDAGLYVFKEGFDSKFLERNFAKPEGNLYDGGFLQDIDSNLEKDEGEGPDDRSDLSALALAAREPDAKTRWARINAVLDLDRFITFMALERMACHADGYCGNCNNYRLYFDPGVGGRAVFLPHGMDDMFGDSGRSLLDEPRALIASTVIQNNAGWKAYRSRIHSLLPLFSPADRWCTRVDEVASRLQAAIGEFSESNASAYPEKITNLKERLVQRADNLKEQDKQPDPELLVFDEKGRAKLTGWSPDGESEGVKHEEIDLTANRKGYVIDAGSNGQCTASWLLRVRLGPGAYTLNARCETKGVIPLDGNDNSGAGIRVSHSERSRGLRCTTKSTPLQFNFTIVEDRREVELVLELRARRGQAIFDASTLVLVRSPLRAGGGEKVQSDPVNK
jgi:hypothetical protein